MRMRLLSVDSTVMPVLDGRKARVRSWETLALNLDWMTIDVSLYATMLQDRQRQRNGWFIAQSA